MRNTVLKIYSTNTLKYFTIISIISHVIYTVSNKYISNLVSWKLTKWLVGKKKRQEWNGNNSEDVELRGRGKEEEEGINEFCRFW